MKRYLIFLTTMLLALSSMATTIKAEEEYLIPSNALFYYSKNYLLMDMDDGSVLFERNGYEKVHPASITKVATLIAALELMEEKNIKTNDSFTFTQEVFTGMASNASIAGFLLGETVTIEDLLYAIIMPSGADATRALSLHLTGDVEALSQNMNKIAEKLELKDTFFVNTSGLDDPKHLSTPYDLAKIIQYSMKNENFVKYYTAVNYTTTSTRQHPKGIDFVNVSLRYGKQLTPDLFTGAKSGHTDLAERALSSVSMYEGMNLIFVSTNAPQEEIPNTNITDAVQTYRYMYRNYNKVTLLEPSEAVLSIPLQYGNEDIIINIDQSLKQYIAADKDIENLKVTTLPLHETLKAPLDKGVVVAKTQVTLEDEVIYEIEHETQKSYQVSIGYRILFTLQTILKVVGVILVVGIIAVLAIRTYHINEAKKRRMRRSQMKNKAPRN